MFRVQVVKSSLTIAQSTKAANVSKAFHRYALNYINALNYLETLRRQQEFSDFEKVTLLCFFCLLVLLLSNSVNCSLIFGSSKGPLTPGFINVRSSAGLVHPSPTPTVQLFQQLIDVQFKVQLATAQVYYADGTNWEYSEY